MNDNIIIYVSGRNNYDMLEGEVLKFPKDGFELINVDDGSCEEEITKGKAICKEHDIVYLQNKSTGVQMATQTLMDFIKENRPNCKYVICFQHDVKPLSENFFTRISQLITDGKLDEFGAIGFNVIDHGKYTKNSFAEFTKGEKPKGMLGLAHLGIKNNKKRWISPHHNNTAVKNPELWSQPFTIDFPAWMVVGINVNNWNECITPTTDYQFHLWFPDLAMQFNFNNKPMLVLPDLYCLNAQEVKSKYGIDENSAHSAKKGNSHHFGEYGPHLKNFEKRWGWNYENVAGTYPKVSGKYVGTLIEKLYISNYNNGPIKTYNLGEY